PRARLAGARGQHAAHADPGRQAPRPLRGKPRGRHGGHVRAPGGRRAHARAHLRSPGDADLRPPAEPARPAAGGVTSMPEVSIVIRCRDEARSLGPVLEAVLAQEGASAAEVVALDSGSRDGTLALLARHPVRVEHLTRFTYGAALNRGAALARGALVVYLSAHCRPLRRDWLAHLLAPFSDPQVVASFGRQVPVPGINPIEALTTARRRAAVGRAARRRRPRLRAAGGHARAPGRGARARAPPELRARPHRVVRARCARRGAAVRRGGNVRGARALLFCLLAACGR